MPEGPASGLKEVRRSSADFLHEAGIHSEDTAVWRLRTNRASDEERGHIGTLFFKDPRVRKALRGEFD